MGNYRKMTAFRQQYPGLKISLGIGGWNEGSKNYSVLASSPERRKTFIVSIVEFLKYVYSDIYTDDFFPIIKIRFSAVFYFSFLFQCAFFFYLVYSFLFYFISENCVLFLVTERTDSTGWTLIGSFLATAEVLRMISKILLAS